MLLLSEVYVNLPRCILLTFVDQVSVPFVVRWYAAAAASASATWLVADKKRVQAVTGPD